MAMVRRWVTDVVNFVKFNGFDNVRYVIDLFFFVIPVLFFSFSSL